MLINEALPSDEKSVGHFGDYLFVSAQLSPQSQTHVIFVHAMFQGVLLHCCA